MPDQPSQPHAPDDPSEGLVRFLHLAGGLKRVPRSGWLDRGVAPLACESVADHSWRVTLLAWLTASTSGANLDLDRVLRLALVHDLAEALAGDQTPYDRETVAGLAGADRTEFLDRRHEPGEDRRTRKAAAERAAFAEMISTLPAALRDELAALQEEMLARETPEAQFVKAMDRVETFLQSREYAAEIPELPVASFAAEVAETITDPAAVGLRDAISAHGFGEAEDGPAPG